MKLHNVTQGSPEWHALRAPRFTFGASDAAAMMGASPYTTRADLLRRKATGITPEVDPREQALFDRGHAAEANFRPIAEQLLDGEDLAPVTGSIDMDGFTLLASFDGLTFDRSTGYEHKLFNASLAKAIEFEGEPGPAWYWQMEHQLLVSGAQRILFVTSDGTRDCCAHCFYESKPERRAKLIAGWKQFAADLTEYEPEAAPTAKPVGRTPENLPALHIEISGQVRASNLATFHEHALAVLGGINRTLTTDQHFADAEKTVRWCEGVEGRLAAAKQHALSQTASIEELFRTIDDVGAETRRVRLELSNLVKARKEALKGEIVAEAATKLREHMSKLAASVGLPVPAVPADFGGAIKNKKSFQSMRDSVDQVLADAKMAASDLAHRMAQNLRTLEQHADLAHLFPDRVTLAIKMPDDLQAVVANRVAEHRRKEEERLQAERERIRAEEAERLQREADERAAAEKKAADDAAAAEAEARAEAERQFQQDALPAAAPAQAPAPMVDARPPFPRAEFQYQPPAPPEEKPTLKLGEINQRLGFTVSADFLAGIGYPASVQRSACLYRESQFPAICDAIRTHIVEVRERFAYQALTEA
jgi:predicted phage-related endonuclease